MRCPAAAASPFSTVEVPGSMVEQSINREAAGAFANTPSGPRSTPVESKKAQLLMDVYHTVAGVV